MNTQDISLLAFLLERIRNEVLVIPWHLPVAVPVGSSFLDEVIGNRKEVKSVLDEFLVLFRSISARSARTCIRRCRRSSTIDMLCTVLWVQHRVVHTVRCFQLL